MEYEEGMKLVFTDEFIRMIEEWDEDIDVDSDIYQYLKHPGFNDVMQRIVLRQRKKPVTIKRILSAKHKDFNLFKLVEETSWTWRADWFEMHDEKLKDVEVL